MPFLGTIPPAARSILREVVEGWDTSALAIGCSGNFTIERTMDDLGLELHSCDVSLYSYAIGSALSGQEVDIRLNERGREIAPWAADYLGDADSAAVSLMLLLDYGPSLLHPERIYSQHVLRALARDWPALHARGLAKLREKRPARVASYFNGDVRRFIAEMPADVPFVSFPPFYEGGYETMFKPLTTLIDWPAPSYEVINDDAVAALLKSVQERCERWALGLKERPEALEPLLRGVVEKRGNIPMYVYASEGPTRYAAPAPRKMAPLMLPELGAEDEVTADSSVEIVKVALPYFEQLRVRHLAKHIATVPPTAAALVLVDGKVAGAFGISAERFKYNGAYLLSDFAVSRSGRMSKLVVYAVLSREAQLFIEGTLNRRIRTLLTTAFSEHPTSMKYRGLFRLASRKGPGEDGRYQLNYSSPTGRWTLQEGFETWLSKHR